MIKNALNKYFLSCLFCVASCVLFSQTKSNNIQTIDGAKYYIHKIEKSQSLYSISKLYNVSLDEIYLLNPEAKTGVKVAQEIKIPFKGLTSVETNTLSTISKTVTVVSKTVAPVTNTVVTITNNSVIDTNLYYTHKVLKKETLYAISKKFSLSETELKIFNPTIASQGLKDGQIIIVGEKKKKVVVKPIEPRIVSTNADSANPDVIHKQKKSTYNIALVLPFKLDQTLSLEIDNLVKTNTNFPTVPALSVDFYLGFKKAVDSLTIKDFEVNMDLFDVDDKDSLKLNQIVNDSKFKQTDFIFGPLHANGFKTIAQKAKEFGIPIVSPITQQNKMLYNNVYSSKVNPSQFTLLESLADYCIDSLLTSNANIILMAPFANDSKEISYVKAFKKYFNDKQKQLGKAVKDTVTVVKGLDGVKKAYVPGVKNIIVTLSINQIFIADFTTQLAIFADKKDITLCGWQNIANIDNIDQEYLNQLQYTFPSQYNITNTATYNSIIDSYKAQQNVMPSEYYFIGFDIALYYLKNLRDIGPDFIFNLNSLSAETNYIKFKFTRPDNLTGFDNRGVYIFRYKDYQLQKTGWR
jgi:LysM repeat protein